MSTTSFMNRTGHRKQSSSSGPAMGALPVEMILDILCNAQSLQALQTILQLSIHNTRVMQVFLLNKDIIYTAIARREFTPLEDALAAASMVSIEAPSNDFDELDDPTAPLTLLSEREGNNKSLRIRDKGPQGLEERIQKLLRNDIVVCELQKIYEMQHGPGHKLSPKEKAVFRQCMYRIWAFTAGIPRYGERCVFDHDEMKDQYWEVRFLSRYSAKEICDLGKVYAFLVGLVIECCRRCQHHEFFEADISGNGEEYLSDVIGYHISKGPASLLELYKFSMAEPSQIKISRRVAWGAVGFQRFLIGDLEYVWYRRHGNLSFRQKSFRDSHKDAICP